MGAYGREEQRSGKGVVGAPTPQLWIHPPIKANSNFFVVGGGELGSRTDKGLEMEGVGVSEDDVKWSGGDGGGFSLGNLTGRRRE